jgi:hypothetical protein
MRYELDEWQNAKTETPTSAAKAGCAEIGKAEYPLMTFTRG